MATVTSHIVNQKLPGVTGNGSIQRTVLAYLAIQDFGDFEGYKVSTMDPILVRVEYEDGYYIIANDEYNVFADATSIEAGVEEFKIHAKQSMKRYLSLDPSAITPIADRIRKLFMGNFHLT